MSTEKKPRINEEIRSDKVFLIGADGEQIGVISVLEAMTTAREANLDLVEVSPNTDKPPVCKIMDYNKFKFQASKRKHAAKKNQKQSKQKEVKMRPSTENADYEVKKNSIIKFLEHGDKAKVTIRFRGREMSHPELGMQLLQKLISELGEIAVVEQYPKFEGRQIVVVLAPKKK